MQALGPLALVQVRQARKSGLREAGSGSGSTCASAARMAMRGPWRCSVDSWSAAQPLCGCFQPRLGRVLLLSSMKERASSRSWSAGGQASRAGRWSGRVRKRSSHPFGRAGWAGVSCGARGLIQDDGCQPPERRVEANDNMRARPSGAERSPGCGARSSGREAFTVLP